MGKRKNTTGGKSDLGNCFIRISRIKDIVDTKKN